MPAAAPARTPEHQRQQAITPGQAKELETLKGRFLAEVVKLHMTFVAAAQAVGVAPTTVWRWRQADPDFDLAYREARRESDTVRVAMVEDSLFHRVVSGTAAPAETIFYLKNRDPSRWRDRIEHTGEDGGPIRHAHSVIMFGNVEIRF